MGKRRTGTEQCRLWNKLAWGNGEQALNSAGFGINWHGETGTGTLELALFSGTDTCNGIYCTSIWNLGTWNQNLLIVINNWVWQLVRRN